jgi:carboxymethylenebutenolidase
MPDQSGTMVEFQSNGATAMGYLVAPTGDGRFPAVVVVQEWWGLNDNIRQLADRFAAEGFVALAPDLYGGRVTTEPDEARKLAMGLDMERVVKDMVGAVNYLCGRHDTSAVSVIGFCMGGSLALLLAARTPRIAAAVSFYGGRPLHEDDVRQLAAPILAFYGGRDQSIPPTRIEQNREVWTRNGVEHEIVVYPDADHAFFNETRPEIYDPAAANDAWKRTLAFFRLHMPPINE